MTVNCGSLLVLLVACTARTTTPTRTPLAGATPLADRVRAQAKAEPRGLDLVLASGRVPPELERVKVVAGRKLGADEVATLLAGVTPWPSPPQDTFAFRDKAPPLPRITTTAHAFPAASAAAPAKAASGALHVVHWQPAPELAVTFDQAMPAAVPVVLTPRPPGDWRWIGTRTLVFEPGRGWPQATSYRAEIAAGTKSAGGGALQEAASFAFETAAPRVVAQFPGAGEPARGTAMALVFDQRIDPAAMLPFVHVTAGGRPIEIAPADGRDVGDPRLAAFVAAAERDDQAGRYVVFRAKSPLPRDAEIAIDVAVGAPSAEGPLVTREAQHVAFRTAGGAGERDAPAPPASAVGLSGPSGLVVVDPSTTVLDYAAGDASELAVQLYRVTPRDYDAYVAFVHGRARPPGRRVLDTRIAIERGHAKVDVSRALHDGIGHVLAIVEPARGESPRLVAWIEVTRLALTAHVDGDHVVAFAYDAATGKAASGVAIELAPSAIHLTTDGLGLAQLALPARGAHLLVARRGDDVAFVPDDQLVAQPSAPPQLAWYVATDRAHYRANEVMRLKGWLRKLDPGRGGDPAAVGDLVAALTLRAFDARGSQIASANAKLDAIGGFDALLTFARAPQPGPARLVLEATGKLTATYTYAFDFDDTRAPQIAVAAHASDGPFVAGGSADVAVDAKYAAGGPVSGAPVQWYVTAAPAQFAPPGHDDFVFGGGAASEPQEWTLAGTTDATGAHVLHLDALSIQPATAMRVIANASVTDANRQTWTASAPLLVHPARWYVGLRAQHRFVERGQPIAIDALAVELDGKPVRGAKLEVVARHGDDTQPCELSGEGTCRFATPDGGEYAITATIVDDRGRANQTQLVVWASGGAPSDALVLVADRAEYAPGQTAEVLVQAPFQPAEGVVTWRRGGIVHVDKLAMAGASAVIRVPIVETFAPSVDVQVDLVGEAGARATGTIELAVPPRRRALAVTVTPNTTPRSPGEHVRVALDVRDAAGKRVPDAELAVIAVDEAALGGHTFADPLAAFHPRREPGVHDLDLRAHAPASGEPPAKPARPPDRAPPADLAAPLAAFVPVVPVDADGHPTVDIQIPDAPARYRIVALAAAGTAQFGKAETTIVGRAPLTIRARPPAFVHAGDRFAVPIVVENHTDAAMTVSLAARATSAVFTDGAGREVAVPANDRVEVDLPATADRAATARFQIVANAGAANTVTAVRLPVRAPAEAETVVQYGMLEHGAIRLPIAPPPHSDPSFGWLEIETASTPLQALTDALRALVHDPHEGADQRAARIIAIMSLGSVLEQFHTKNMPSPDELLKLAGADAERLVQLQNSDGGFARWQRGAPSDPIVTAFVVHALAFARSRVRIDAQALEHAHDYLRRSDSAYALYVRRRLGDLDISKAKQVYADSGAPDHASLETDAMLLATLAGVPDAATERKALLAAVLARLGEADDRTKAILIEALTTEAPTSDAQPKLVAALLAQRHDGRWSSPQDNAFAIASLLAYFFGHDTMEPNFRARVWLGKDFAGDHAFVARQTDRFEVDLPIAQVKPTDLVIQNDGTGHLYYRVAMTYAAADPKQGPIDHGFAVRRRYEAIDDPRDVTRAADGAWHVRAGARVRVYVAVANDDPRALVALDDPLPAGLAPLAAAVDPWIEDQELRDDGVQTYATQLPAGVHVLAYVARATTPGDFHAPPPRVEALYQPELFGRGESDRVIVETTP